MLITNSTHIGTHMSVLKRGNSKYWYIQFQFNGKTYIKSSKTLEKKVAEHMEREWKVKIHSQQYLGEKDTVQFSEVLSQLIQTKEGTPNHPTLKYHKRVLNRLFPVNLKLHEITNTHINTLYQKRLKEGVSNGTIKKSFDLIRTTWKHGKKLGYQYSDLEFPTLKVEKHRLRYLSPDEEKRLLKELDPNRKHPCTSKTFNYPPKVKQSMIDVYDLVVLLIDTGARYSEVAKIEWSSINLDDKTIRLWRPKVRNESVLFMTDRAYQILSKRKQTTSSKYVFSNKNNGPRNTATLPIRKAYKRANIEGCTVHTFRHTHATRLIQNGLSIYEVKEILGHTDINTTLRYAHLERRDISFKARDIINKLNHSSSKPTLTVVKR